MANFIRTSIKTVSYKNDNSGDVIVENVPVNIDLVFCLETYYDGYKKLFCIDFICSGESSVTWSFSTEDDRDNVYSSIMCKSADFKFV